MIYLYSIRAIKRAFQSLCVYVMLLIIILSLMGTLNLLAAKEPPGRGSETGAGIKNEDRETSPQTEGQGQGQGQDEASNPGSTKTIALNSSIYKVGPDDILHIEVYDNPDLMGDFPVSIDGSIVFPLLGQIRVSGLSISQIKVIITERLEKDYLYNPIVSVTMKDFRSKKVKILGNVGKPGIYFLDSPTQLFDLLSRADGISPQLGKIMKGQKARIVRRNYTANDNDMTENPLSTIFIDLYQLLIEGKEDANVYLEDEDIIYIPETQSIHVIGEVKKPGSFVYEEGITVLKAITLAGGPTKKASTKNSFIKRIKDGEEIKISVTMGDLLRPEDILEVPLSFW